MKIILFFIRKLKGFFILFKLGLLFKPIISFLKFFVYLVEFSIWVQYWRKKTIYNDFYSFKFKSNARYLMYENLIKIEKIDKQPIAYLEFGVAKGNSFRWWVNNLKHPENVFYGFDTFEGLPEDWHLYKRGEMAPDVIPKIDDPRAKLIKGLFQDTLFEFLKNFDDDKRKLINLDADLYSSTLFVLTTLAPYLRKNDIIIFDEFGVPLHEFKAFTEFVNSYYVKYEVICAVNNFFQIAIKIL